MTEGSADPAVDTLPVWPVDPSRAAEGRWSSTGTAGSARRWPGSRDGVFRAMYASSLGNSSRTPRPSGSPEARSRKRCGGWTPRGGHTVGIGRSSKGRRRSAERGRRWLTGWARSSGSRSWTRSRRAVTSFLREIGFAFPGQRRRVRWLRGQTTVRPADLQTVAVSTQSRTRYHMPNIRSYGRTTTVVP